MSTQTTTAEAFLSLAETASFSIPAARRLGETLKPRGKKYHPAHAEMVQRLQAAARARHLPEPQELLTVREMAAASRQTPQTILNKVGKDPRVTNLNGAHSGANGKRRYRQLRIPIEVALEYLAQRTSQVTQAPAGRRKFTREDRQQMMRERWVQKRRGRRLKPMAATA